MCDCATELESIAAMVSVNNENICELTAATDNHTSLYECELDRKNSVDLASLALAIATFLLYDQYYDKYEEVLEWRNEISNRIKECMRQDIDHYKDVVMGNMNQVISDILNAPTVTVEYQSIIDAYNIYAAGACQAAFNLVEEQKRKTCREDCIECDHTKGDLMGCAMEAIISAADANARFDEGRIPRRLDMLSAALNSAHGSTFRLPAFDYQAFSNAANIASSLATAYAGIANSALGSFGYFSGNFINSLGGAFGGSN